MSKDDAQRTLVVNVIAVGGVNHTHPSLVHNVQSYLGYLGIKNPIKMVEWERPNLPGSNRSA